MNIKKQVKGFLRNPLLFKKLYQIRDNIFTVIGRMNSIYSTTREPVTYEDRLNLEYKPIEIGKKWGGFFDCAWFNFKGQIPDKFIDEKICVIINIDGEGCIFDDEGSPIKGLTKIMGIGDAFNSVSGKKIYELPAETKDIDLWVETGNNGFNGKSTGQAKLKRADIVIKNSTINELYYNYLVLYFLLTSLDSNSERYLELQVCLKKVAHILKKYTDDEISQASNLLKIELDKTNSDDEDFTFYATGHSHLDLAWLWPIRETKRKAARTFSNQLSLIENTNDYIYGASQPQQFDWVKNAYPQLYNRILTAVEQGRLEPQGGMWVESDTNVPSGESLVRQILYGKKFFKTEFNQDMKILWLPDVFGFSGALPQLIKKSGMEYFLTIKLSWNEQNKFPYHSFVWEGIDGSSILVHMPPEGTYNSDGYAGAIMDAYDKYSEKDTKCALITYGIGDGGGGPGEAHYAFISKAKNLKGVKKVEASSAVNFFDRLNKSRNILPYHKGELYLEKHQGTFTTQAKNKLYNRKIEFLLRNIEILATYAQSYDYKYPSTQLEKIWKEVLLYQFHDIIPGSSINRVYTESVARYKEMIEELKLLYGDITKYLSKKSKSTKSKNTNIYAINTLQYNRDEYIKHNNRWFKAQVQPFASSQLNEVTEQFNSLSFSENSIENEKFKIRFNNNGIIISLYDKCNEVELNGDYLNTLTIYKDKKLFYNAWDIDFNYMNKKKSYMKLVSLDTFIDGPCIIRRNTFKYNKSTLIQDIILTENYDYIEFKTNVDWHEKHKMLRADFIPSVYSDKVLCDIQWGNLERSTKTDDPISKAQYEICAHKYVDVTDSQSNIGFSLINDCKYGHRVKDGLISLNLLRSPVFPDKTADRGEHSFSYAIYPHKGTGLDSRLIEYANRINNPLMLTDNSISIDSIMSINTDSVIIEVLKKSEDLNGVIVRLFETKGSKAQAKLDTTFKFDKAYSCSLLEEIEQEIDVSSLQFDPYEIKTILLK